MPSFLFSERIDRFMAKESVFQHKLIEKLKRIFPGCMVLKNDPNYIQGIPDLIIVYNNRWAMLECKKQIFANRQPNQEYYINKLNEMSFARFISPETEEEVLNELKRTWET